MMQGMDFNLNNFGDEYQKTEFTIGNCKFSVEKLRAMEGYWLLEQIRYEFRNTVLKELGDDENALFASFFMLDPQFVETVRKRLFQRVKFTNESAITAQQLAGAEDIAFTGLEPLAIYEIIVRCLMINFSNSLRDILDLLSRSNNPDTQSSNP